MYTSKDTDIDLSIRFTTRKRADYAWVIKRLFDGAFGDFKDGEDVPYEFSLKATNMYNRLDCASGDTQHLTYKIDITLADPKLFEPGRYEIQIYIVGEAAIPIQTIRVDVPYDVDAVRGTDGLNVTIGCKNRYLSTSSRSVIRVIH